MLDALTAIVDTYGEEIKDVAPDMMQALLAAFFKYAHAAGASVDSSDPCCVLCRAVFLPWAGPASLALSHVRAPHTRYSTPPCVRVSVAGEDDDAAFSASHCLDSAMAVVDAVGEDPACLAALAPHVLPVVHWALTTDGCYEYLDHAVGFLSYYTYRSASPISVCVTVMSYIH